MFCAALHRAPSATGSTCTATCAFQYRHRQWVLFMRMQIQNRNLEPALQWVEDKRADLAAARQSYEAFEFQLHRLQFLRILTQQGAPCVCSMHVSRVHSAQCLSWRLPLHQLVMRSTRLV